MPSPDGLCGANCSTLLRSISLDLIDECLFFGSPGITCLPYVVPCTAHLTVVLVIVDGDDDVRFARQLLLLLRSSLLLMLVVSLFYHPRRVRDRTATSSSSALARTRSETRLWRRCLPFVDDAPRVDYTRCSPTPASVDSGVDLSKQQLIKATSSHVVYTHPSLMTNRSNQLSSSKHHHRLSRVGREEA